MQAILQEAKGNEERRQQLRTAFAAADDEPDAKPKPKPKPKPKAKLQGKKAKLASVFGGDSDEEDAAPNAKAAEEPNPMAKPKASKPSLHRVRIGANMEAFMQELKQSQGRADALGIKDAEIAARQAAASMPGSHDTGDPTTTNIYVGNLSPTVTEEKLEEEFGKYGDIYSVKIMWPRTDEEKARRRNSGFVCFCERPDAEDAFRNMADMPIDGQPLALGWGRKIAMRGRGLAEKKLASAGGPSPSPNPNPNPYPNPNPSAAPPNIFLSAGPSGAPALPDAAAIEAMIAAAKPKLSAPDVPPGQGDVVTPIEAPQDRSQRLLINMVARYVATDGKAFEDSIKAQEASNPRFRFLFDPKSADGLFYCWRVLSYCNGDTEYEWRTEPFQIVEGGPYYRPPPPLDADAAGADEAAAEAIKRDRMLEKARAERRRVRAKEEREAARLRGKPATGAQLEKSRGRGIARARLGAEGRGRLERLLGELTLSRRKIKEAMGFCLDQAECSGDIIARVFASFREADDDAAPDPDPNPRPSADLTPNLMLARLYLVSDVLYNSSSPVKNAWRFREHLESFLPRLMEVCGLYVRAASRLTADGMRSKIEALLNVWNRWSLYSGAYMMGLQYSFLVEGLGEVPPGIADADGEGRTVSEEDEELYRRKARRLGVRGDDTLPAAEVRRRVEAAKRYAALIEAARRARLRELNPDIEFNDDDEDDDDRDSLADDIEDLDGAPLEDSEDGSDDPNPNPNPKSIPNPKPKPSAGTWAAVADEPKPNPNDDGDDIDGDPIDDDDDIDGDPIDDDDDEDIDGEPME